MKSFIVFSVRAAPWHVVVVLWWWWWWCAFRPPRPIKISLTHDFTPKIKPIKPPLPFIFLHLRTCRIWLVCNLSLKASCCIVIGHAPPPTHFLPPPATRPQPWTTLDPGACASWMMTFNLLYFDASEMFNNNTHTTRNRLTELDSRCSAQKQLEHPPFIRVMNLRGVISNVIDEFWPEFSSSETHSVVEEEQSSLTELVFT